jgi:opacity protein-like surface antigen
MTRTTITAAGTLALALALGAPAVAAQRLRPALGVAGSRTLPVGDYHATANGEGFNAGWQGLVLAALTFPRRRFGLRLDATYGVNRANGRLEADLAASLGQPATERTKLLGADLDATYAVGRAARATPYVLGGLGLYRVTVSATSGGLTADNSATRFAWNLGAGVSYAVGRIAAFLEARYVAVAAVSGFPQTTFFPLTLGVRSGGR